MGSAYYRKDLGKATVNRKRLVAGSVVDLRLTYKAGRFGIDDSGGIMVIGRFASDAAPLQFDDPTAANYVKLSCSNPAVNFVPRWGPKIFQRPWGRGFEARISGAFLCPGDEIRVDFRRWRMQTFCEKTFELRTLVDQFATCDYVPVPRSPEIELVAGKAAKLVVVAPSRIRSNASFALGVKLEDKWGNPCRQLSSTVKLRSKAKISGLPREVRLKQGALRISGLKAAAPGVIEITANCGRLSTEGNPARVVAAALLSPYWGDLHAQSEETIGTASVEEYFAFARDYAFLDVIGHQGNDFQITKAFWKRLNATTRKFNRDGRLVAFPGFEWSGNTGSGGDRNVINMTEGGPLHRSSHALVDDYSDIKTDANTATELFRRLKGRKSLVFAHVGGRYANMDMHDDAVERAIEIHSAWGTFEWLLFDSLKKGYRVGVVANSDGHKCRPGASYPGSGKFGCYGGLTCILAKKLARREIFQAIFARHTYATTGARIGLDVSLCDSGGKARAIMGDVVSASKAGNVLHVSALGTSPIERAEVYSGTRRIALRQPELPAGAPVAVKVLTAGSEVRGRARLVEWLGTLRVSGAKLRSFEQVNFLDPEKGLKRGGRSELLWNGVTTGGVQGAILVLDRNSGTIDFETNRAHVRAKVSELSTRPKVFRAGGLDARVELYLAPPKNASRELSFELPLQKLHQGDNPVFVKVTQRDGHMAWSSPIYVRA
jgi:hypothetical protein